MTSRPAYFERLMKFVRRKGRSVEDSEDLIQEALLRLHAYRREKTVRNEEAFLRQAVSNLSVDQHRRERPDLWHESPIEELRIDSRAMSQQPTPEEQLDYQQQLEEIGTLLNTINPRTKEIYFAHRSGYSYAEIAEHLKIAEITIERHIARAVLAIMDYRAARGDREANGNVANNKAR